MVKVAFRYNQELVQWIKSSALGAKWNRDEKVWEIPDELLDGLEGRVFATFTIWHDFHDRRLKSQVPCLYSIFIATDADTVLGNNWITKNFRPLSKPWGVGSKVKGKQLNRYGASSCVPSRGCRGFNTRTGNALPRACCFCWPNWCR